MRALRWAVTGGAISTMGAVLTTVSAALFLVFVALDAFRSFHNPYIGLLVYVLLPAVSVLGLLLIPLGHRRRRRIDAAGAQPEWPRLDLNNPATRRTFAIVTLATVLNVVIISMASYGAVQYMETPTFCGQVCHTVMQPEFVAFQSGPHARVVCVECHVGGGAVPVARAKLTGVRRLARVVTNRYPRPIPAPVHSLRPAADTCEHCHWPDKFHGDILKVVREYADDQANTETVTTLRVHVGGGSERLGIASGIHWHMNLANEVEYITTDEKRGVIPYVRIKDRLGNVREYVTPGTTPEQLANGERRRMDCMDCHSRPAHTMSPTAERAVDRAIALGTIDRSLPFVRREIVKAVKQAYPDQDAASRGIEETLRAFYRSQGPSATSASIDRAVAAAERLYRTNVFPAMRVTWGTYVSQLGHVDAPGCFRCHDENHKSNDGKTIGQDCESCHHIE